MLQDGFGDLECAKNFVSFLFVQLPQISDELTTKISFLHLSQQ